MLQTMAVQVSSQEEAWITPKSIISLIEEVLGFIDLDPASSLEANKIVGAKKFFTKQDNALLHNWNCETFFLNPPYGKIGNKSQAGVFAEYAIDQYQLNNIKQGGVILLHDRSGYGWFESLALRLPCVTLRERVRFINPNTMKQGDQAKTAQTLFLLGDRFTEKFEEVFRNYGRIYKPLNIEKSNFSLDKG
jgi:phage N-6-adenine-methyltransferase